MAKGSKRRSAPWVGAALVGAGVVSAGACGGVTENDLFDSGAASGATGGRPATTSTSSLPSTSGTSTGQGGDSTSSGMGPGGSGGGGSTTTTTSTGSSTSSTSSTSSGGPLCGNGAKEAGEACDGAQLGGATCTNLGYSKGDGLKCVNCQLDSEGCKPTCGDGKMEPTEACDDGNTTPGDGCDAACKMEVVMGTTCGSAIPISVGLGGQDVSGTTLNGGAHTAAGCTSAASDRVYAVKATANGFLTANLVRSQTSFDSVLYLTTACSDAGPTPDLLCNDSQDPQNQVVLNGGEIVSVRVQQGQTYFLIVDGPAAANAGTYKLHLDLSLGTDCGDPVPIPLENGTGMTVLGSNTGISANPTVAGSCGGSPGGQVIYAVTRASNGSTDVDTVAGITNYNSVLYARSTCNNGISQTACSNAGGNAVESISTNNVNAGTAVYIYVDGSAANNTSPSGNYGVTFTP